MAAVATRLVRVLDSGHVCLINAGDFDAKLHADASAPAPPAAAEEPDVEADITALNVADSRLVITNAESAEELDVLEAEELANESRPGGRKGVLAAIAERRAELEAS